MTTYSKAIQENLCQSDTSKVFAEKFFSVLGKTDFDALEKIIQVNIKRYKQNHDLHLALRGCLKKGAEIEKVTLLVPTFIFRVCSDLVRNENLTEPTIQLLIAGLNYRMGLEENDPEARIRLFMKNIDSQNKHGELLKKLKEQNDDYSYYPKLFNYDLMIMNKYQISFPVTKEVPRQIEMLFCFLGYSQTFLRYYFDLITQSQSDDISRHIHDIFITVFNSVRLQEAMYWKNYGQGNALQKSLLEIIKSDEEDKAHKFLKVDAFSTVAGHFPLLFAKNGAFLNENATRLVKEQKKALDSLSEVKLSFFLDAVRRMKGNSDLGQVLSLIRSTNQEKLMKLYNHLRDSNDQVLSNLTKLMSTYVSKLAGSSNSNGESGSFQPTNPNLVLTEDSQRQMAAKKKLLSLKDQNSLNQFKIQSYLDDVFKKLYEKYANPNALNQHSITKYLEALSKAAKKVVTQPVVTPKAIKEFNDTTDEIMDQIADDGELSHDELEEFKEDLQSRAGQLSSPDIGERIEATQQMGKTLTKAGKMAQGEDLPEELENHHTEMDVEGFLVQKVVPIGFDKHMERISVGDFFKFPLGERKGPPEGEEWHTYHMGYLRLALENNVLNMKTYQKIIKVLPKIQEQRYKKYFDIFPNDQFDDSVFMAVFSMFQNKAFDRLKIV